MASGSNAPFSGEFKELENVPDLLKGVTLDEYAEFRNSNAGFHERSDLEQSLNAFNYDDGFVDIFFNESKIQSKEKVTVITGANPSVTTQKGTEKALSFGNGSGNALSSTSFNVTFKKKGIFTTFKLRNDEGSIDITIEDSNGNVLLNGTIFGSFGFASKTFSVDDYSRPISKGETVTVTLTGELFADDTGSSIENSIVSTGNVKVKGQSDFLFQAKQLPASSGTITHTSKDLGFVPSKIVASPEFSTDNPSESVQLEIIDNNGNSVNLTESDFGTDKSVNFTGTQITPKVTVTGDGDKSAVYKKTLILGV